MADQPRGRIDAHGLEDSAQILTFPPVYPNALTPAQTGLLTRILSNCIEYW